jgi:hypothetical protein
MHSRLLSVAYLLDYSCIGISFASILVGIINADEEFNEEIQEYSYEMFMPLTSFID